MIRKTTLAGLFLSVFLAGCSSLSTDVQNKQATSPVKTEKQESKFLHAESKNLRITDDSVYYLNKINNGAIPLMDSPVTLIFIEDDGLKNVAKGYSGCNDYYFKYQVSDNIFVLGEIVTTNFKCGKQEARFENFLFRELSKNPKIKINKDYVVIKGYDTELLWQKKDKNPKAARKVITSTPKSAPDLEVVAYTEIKQEKPQKIEKVKVTPTKKPKSIEYKKYVNEHKGVVVNETNIEGLHIYKKSLTLAENKEIRKKALVIRNRLGPDTRIMNLNLKNGDTIPLIEYRVKNHDTLKKIIMPTYPVGEKVNWLRLIERLNQVVDLNTRVKNIDQIYPYHKIYVPVFKN